MALLCAAVYVAAALAVDPNILAPDGEKLELGWLVWILICIAYGFVDWFLKREKRRQWKSDRDAYLTRIDDLGSARHRADRGSGRDVIDG